MNYDPFVKDDFVLPEKWCIKIPKFEDAPKEIIDWRVGVKKCGTWSNAGYLDNSGWYSDNIIDGYTEISFDQFKKYVLKQNVEKGKEVIPEYVELLDGFDNTCTGKIFDTNQPIPQMSGWSNQWTWESIFKNNIQRTYFKPSTKEAFDAQNQPKSIEKWSVGSYFVIEKDKLYNISSSKRGDICLIKENGYFNFINKKDTTYWSFDLREGSSWFATKSEAEKFAKTLAEPVNRGNGILDAVDVKQPLKQVVHCKTQEEWDFVSNKIGYKFINKFELGNSDTINPVSKGCQSKSFFEGHEEYQILSFQEWCDLNGYKMETNIDLTGRHLRALIDGPQSTIYKKGDIVDIFKKESSNQYRIGKVGDGWWTYTTNNGTESQWELLPEDYKMEKKAKFEVGDYVVLENAGGWSYSTCNDGCLGLITKIGNFKPSTVTDYICSISGNILNSNNKDTTFRDIPIAFYHRKRIVRHATSEEINQHLISIGQIPAGEPLNTGIEPNKDGMFKYKQTMPGASWSGGTIDNHLDVMIPTTGNSYNKDFSTSIIPVKSISAEVEFNYLPEPK